ncbi:hypothetical protein Taro_048892 [Colocasia esculenta]|uniref:Uncharacterized protein n=1 Tax=Colocasia esculenta TaxID=4460 RepID=A0A843X9F3_COLES|nr:hypothetical protein [Colocasia esculenta]
MAMVGVSACVPGQGVPLGPSGGNATGCLLAFSDQSFSGRAVCAGVGRRPFWGFPEGVPCVPVPAGLVFITSQLCCFYRWLPRQYSFARCSALEGLSAKQVVTIAWDPQPRASVSDGVDLGGGRAQVMDLDQKRKAVGTMAQASPSHCLALHWFRSGIGRSSVGPQFGWTAVFVMLVCRVAPLVERCYTWLWLLPAWLRCIAWLLCFGDVSQNFFVVVLVSVVWLVAVALPSRLRCIAWLPYVLVMFSRTVGCCPGLRYPDVVLAIAFWWVFPERGLGGFGGEQLLALWVEVLPKLPILVLCCALGCVSGRGAGQVVFPSVFGFSWLRWWDFVCPHGREVGFVSRTLWTLPDGSLLCLEALVAVGHVALPTCGGRSGAL